MSLRSWLTTMDQFAPRCIFCNRKMRNAVACRVCGQQLCSQRCAANHLEAVHGGNHCLWCNRQIRNVVQCVFCKLAFCSQRCGQLHWDAANHAPAAAVLALLCKHLGGRKNPYLHPDIPQRKKANTQKAYGSFLQPGEDILLVYDGTFFGSAKAGFIMTDRGIGWAATFCAPSYCVFAEMDVGEIRKVASQPPVLLLHGEKPASVFATDMDAVVEGLKGFLGEIAPRVQQAPSPPTSGHIGCPQCGATLRVPESAAGKKVRCPKCHAAIG